jgi:hypothetical protein
MGYMRHHAIILTGSQDLSYARERAIACGNTRVTELVGPAWNGTYSFMVAPDGSKEGWEESDRGDEARARFIQEIRTDRHGPTLVHDEGPHRLGVYDWVEVQFGDGGLDTRVTDDSDHEHR